jgi:hypothetical protein
MVWGWLGPRDLVEYYAGIFNGKGPNQPFNLDGFFLYAGRVAVNPLGRPRAFQEGAVNLPRDPRLSIGLNAAGQVRQIGTVTIGGAEVPNRVTVTALGADVYFAARWGASFYGEVYFRDTEETDTGSRRHHAVPRVARAGGVLHPAPRPAQPPRGGRPRAAASTPPDCLTRTRAAGTCDIRPYPSHTRENYRDFMNTTRDLLRGELVPARARLQGPGLVHDLQ